MNSKTRRLKFICADFGGIFIARQDFFDFPTVKPALDGYFFLNFVIAQLKIFREVSVE